MNITEIEHQIATTIREGRALTGKDGILTPMIQRARTAALEGEMGHSHLGEESSSSNRRNRYSRKQVKSGAGMLDIATPRDLR